MTLPTVDISAWIDLSDTDLARIDSLDEFRRARISQAAHEWSAAMKSWGLALIKGHMINYSLIETLNNNASKFFEKSMDEKLRYYHGYYGHPLGGYTPPGVESVARSNGDNASVQPDPVENFVYCYDPDWFQPKLGAPTQQSPIDSAGEYFKKMENLLRTIHRLSAYSLNLKDIDYFNKFYFYREDNTMSDEVSFSEGTEKKRIYMRPRVLNGSALRLSRYFPRKPTSLVTCEYNDEDLLQYGAHTDYQGFTILRPDPNDWNIEGGRGLQVQNPTTLQWIPVQIPSGQDMFVVNAGDLFQRWTNDRWLSANHRVIGPVPNTPAGQITRQSIVFFSGPYEDVLVESIKDDENTESKYPPIISGDHLRLKLSNSNV